LTNTLEELTDSGSVTDESGSHFETSWWDIAHSGHDVVWDPLNEVGGVLGLDVKHLLFNFLC